MSGRGVCDELITRPEESYRVCCVVVCDLETSRTGAPYIYDIRRLRVKWHAMNRDMSVGKTETRATEQPRFDTAELSVLIITLKKAPKFSKI